MSYDGKINTDRWFPVACYDGSMDPVSGVIYTRLLTRYANEASTSLTTYSPDAADWRDLGSGQYRLQMGASEFTESGLYSILIRDLNGVFKDFNFVVNVGAIYEYDMKHFLNAIYSKLPTGNISDFENSTDEVIVGSISTSAQATISGNVDSALTGYDAPTVLDLLTTESALTDLLNEKPNINTIIASGNAEGWNDIADVSNLALQSTLISVSGDISSLNDISVSDIVTAGDSAGWGAVTDPTEFVTELLSTEIDGVNISGINEKLLALGTGRIEKSGESYIYYKQDNTTISHTLTASGNFRVRS